MSDEQPTSNDVESRFAADGTLEVFDGQAWVPYRPPEDDGYGAIFKSANPPAITRQTQSPGDNS